MALVAAGVALVPIGGVALVPAEERGAGTGRGARTPVPAGGRGAGTGQVQIAEITNGVAFAARLLGARLKGA